jgi:hypothetical protein
MTSSLIDATVPAACILVEEAAPKPPGASVTSRLHAPPVQVMASTTLAHTGTVHTDRAKNFVPLSSSWEPTVCFRGIKVVATPIQTWINMVDAAKPMYRSWPTTGRSVQSRH